MILWSDETKRELCSHNFEHHIERKPDNIHHLFSPIAPVQHGGGSSMLWGVFSSWDGGGLSGSQKKLNGAKCLVKTSSRDLRTEYSPTNKTWALNRQTRQDLRLYILLHASSTELRVPILVNAFFFLTTAKKKIELDTGYTVVGSQCTTTCCYPQTLPPNLQ